MCGIISLQICDHKVVPCGIPTGWHQRIYDATGENIDYLGNVDWPLSILSLSGQLNCFKLPTTLSPKNMRMIRVVLAS